MTVTRRIFAPETLFPAIELFRVKVVEAIRRPARKEREAAVGRGPFQIFPARCGQEYLRPQSWRCCGARPSSKFSSPVQ
jgi:hypothetical protein